LPKIKNIYTGKERVMMKDKKSMKSQIIKIVIIVYIITSIASFSLIYLTLDNKIEELGTKFSIQYLLKEKNRITTPIEKEIALSQKLADTPTIKKWAQNEKNEDLKERAIAELESYRKHFQDKSYFFVIHDSGNYYFNNKKDEFANNQYRYTLDPENEKDKWYFKTMQEVDDFILNVNYDRVLNTTKLWIDAIIYNNNGQKVGMAGTGFSLDQFLNNFLETDSPYITPIMFDKKGFVQAHQNEEYITLSAISASLAQEKNKTIFDLLGTEDQAKIRSIMQNLQSENKEVSTADILIDGKNRIAAVSFIPSINWYIMILLDTSEIFSIWDFTPTILILVSSLLLLVIAIVYFINKIVINPINKLTGFTEVIAAGNYDKTIDIKSNNELGKLADSFNKMAATIREHTNNLEQLVQKRTEKLTETNQELSKKNKKIMDNINYAKYIQRSILPETEDYQEYFADSFIIWKPRDLVGGDFYWVKEIDNRLLIAVIDCTGHGVPGALMTMTTNAVLNRIVDKDHIKDPAKLLNKLNIVLKETLHKSDENNDHKRDDGLDISLCSIDKSKQKLMYAGAKMSLYYTENGEVKLIKGDRQSIGYQFSKEDYQYQTHTIDIDNRTFYITTDGYLDQHGGKDDKRYSRKRFIKLLKRNQDKDLQEQKYIYQQELKEFMGGNEQRDDITLIGFKIRSS